MDTIMNKSRKIPLQREQRLNAGAFALICAEILTISDLSFNSPASVGWLVAWGVTIRRDTSVYTRSPETRKKYGEARFFISFLLVSLAWHAKCSRSSMRLARSHYCGYVHKGEKLPLAIRK